MIINHSINDLISIFGSRAKAQEAFLILSDNKRLIRQGFYEEEIENIEDFCKGNDIFCVKSKFKIILESEDKENYSNKGMVVNIDDKRRGIFYLYMSKYEELAYYGALFEIRNEILELGKALGYPDCCINFFIDNWSSKNPDPHHEPTNEFTNISRRNKDFVLLSHFPCSSECKKSIEIGKIYYNALKEHDERYAKEILDKLSI